MAVTSTNNLRKGSSGNDVLELQKKLNATGNGYNLAEDGVFGENTLAAVKDYQQKNNLTVDGIVGTNTWGALTGSVGGSSGAGSVSAVGAAPTFNYTPSDTVTQAEALLQQHLAQKPGEWQGGTWTDDLNGIISQILNREKFHYDLNGDALYQQYTDQYTTQGKLASMDTAGQAAAMTGGFGNSYAQSVGQQAYQAYLQQLNEVVPELYAMQLDQYNQEGQALYDQASILAGMDEQEYGRYQDTVSNYYTELNSLMENARYMSETEYEKALNDFNIKYGSYRDTVADDQWQQSFNEGVRQFNESQKVSQVGNTGDDDDKGVVDDEESGKVKYTAPAGWDTARIKRFQEASGLVADGVWGAKTQAAYEPYTKVNFSTFDAGDWEGYFASIRQSDGRAAAEEEIQLLVYMGLLPQNMVTYAAMGARGGQMGH